MARPVNSTVRFIALIALMTSLVIYFCFLGADQFQSYSSIPSPIYGGCPDALGGLSI